MKLRFFFDAGSGICMWSADEISKEKFDGYPVECNELPLPENLWRKLRYLTAWYDTSIDWSYLPDPTPWSNEECLRFNEEVSVTLKEVITKIGCEYTIENEFEPITKNS
jgi:hypothetical protein